MIKQVTSSWSIFIQHFFNLLLGDTKLRVSKYTHLKRKLNLIILVIILIIIPIIIIIITFSIT